MGGWLAVEDWDEAVYAIPDPPVVLQRVEHGAAMGSVIEAGSTSLTLLVVDKSGKTREVRIGVRYIPGSGPWNTPGRAIEEGINDRAALRERARAAVESIEKRIAG